MTFVNRNPDYLYETERAVSITPGELRGRLQPTILLRMTGPVDAAPGNTDGDGKVFRAGLIVFAQYIGNGRLILTPIDNHTPWGSQVVMASALNTTAEIITQGELARAFRKTDPADRLTFEHDGHDGNGALPSLAGGLVGT